eukprot:TRINITY_DN6098_c0_g1_i1.p1 TRINITY_DN6098_c0_g1~~TRINITY_DN6098_c0_g1_i1.p1  ORF type:complete len:208 (+),score=56.30 TRINITY_DN6098_c0_g1_i1:64-687(+)
MCIRDRYMGTLDTLITSDINSSADKMLNNPWRGAEAWHFYILAHKHLYNGDFKTGLKAALRLAEYELEMEPKRVYTLIALAAYLNGSFRECSRAFVKLESIQSLTPEERERFESLAVAIFSKHEPRDTRVEEINCPSKNCGKPISEFATNCKHCGANYQPCVASGKSIFLKEYYTCKACKHKSLERELLQYKLNFCALCHHPIERRL